jgi:hypothetical protein
MSEPICPFCKATRWHIGPCGGLSVNIMCQGCERWFNFTPMWGEGHELYMQDLHEIGPDRTEVRLQ